jgi:hypothetical protein
MKAKWFCGILFILICSVAIAQSPAIDLPLIVSSDAGSKLELHFGLDSLATDTLDNELDEKELPPFPPSDVLEARFIGDDVLLPQLGQGTYYDYRMGDADFEGTKTHELKSQIGAGTKITFKWNLPKGITGLIQDFFNGVLINKVMSGSDSLVLEKAKFLEKLLMIIKYTGIPLTPKLVSPANDSSNIFINPSLYWHPSRTADSYQLQIDTVADFLSIVIDESGIADTSFKINVLEKYSSYYWRVNATSAKGTSDWSEVWHFTTGNETPVSQFESTTPLKFNLSQNYPNPFNPSTIIRFTLPKQLKVRLQIFDLLGREIAVLLDQEMQPGEHQVVCELSHLPNGVYIYRLSAGRFVEQRKMILLK